MIIRRFTTLIAALATGAVLALAGTPRYVFYFIGDGMGWGAVSAANLYSRTVGSNPGQLLMFGLPVVGSATTHSWSSPVTDSAAAGTALATGHKTVNGMLGMTPDSAAVESFAVRLHDAGWGVGLVTTGAPDDATPGAFYAHVPSRSMFYEIGCQAAASGYEFISGANLRGMRDRDGRSTGLTETIEQSGMAIVHGLEELSRTESRRVMLLNTDTLPEHSNDIGYHVDAIEGVLTLPDMTRACLDHLMANTPDRFFMMVEGGAIDHAGHSNDIAASIGETLAFDRSLAIAYEFYKSHPDETLIVITADHETGGLAVANRKLHYYADMNVISHVRSSKDRFTDRLSALTTPMSWEGMQEELKRAYGLYGEITPAEDNDSELRQIYEEKFSRQLTADEQRHAAWAMSEAACRAIERLAGIGWTTGDHSGALVPVIAVGAGSDLFAGIMDNTEIPERITRAITGE